MSSTDTAPPRSVQLATVPEGDPRDRGGPAQPMLIVSDLKKHFPIKGGLLNRTLGHVRAVDGVSFTVLKGETLGVVGESGCGKSTLARLLMHLVPHDAGEVLFDGEAIGGVRGLTMKEFRRAMQMVFQDSYSSLNPRLPVQESIAYGPKVHGMAADKARDLAGELLSKVGLKPDLFAQRYPHELSGGQKQRVNIARALALEPRLLILDEAVSALDKSVEAQVLNLLRQLKRHFNLTYVFISHDLDVVQYISDRVLVMYLGEIVEIGPVDAIYDHPKHPYTRALLASRLSSGCRFRTRCPMAEAVCAEISPRLSGAVPAGQHVAACHVQNPGSGHSLAGKAPVMVPRPAPRPAAATA
jgi:peptide/nickel transport system ATP-binding protein